MAALAGLLVVSLEQAVAAPFATRQLADLGARVIKIERPEGDFAREYDHAVRGGSSYFVWLNRSKESVVLDLKTPPGRRALDRLLARADVFVQNLAPGSVDRLGWPAAALRAARPELITCAITGYGSGGPWQDRKAYDALIQSETGLVSITGTPEAPAKVGISVADIAAGMHAFAGILAALYRRERTGDGATLEVSLLDALGEWMSQPALTTRYTGQEPPRSGAHHAIIAPYGPYPAADGTVQLAIQNEREWRRFAAAVLDAPGLATDPRFDHNAARVRHRAELDREIAARTGSLPAAELVARLDAARIANARVNPMAGFLAHEQLAARDRWASVATPGGPVQALLPPVSAAELPVRLDPVPALGADTEAVLAELGLSGPEPAEPEPAEPERAGPEPAEPEPAPGGPR